MSEAKRQIVDGHADAAIMTAYIACDLMAEGVLTRGFEVKGVPELRDPVLGRASGSVLNNDRLRAIYIAITGDAITSQPFWQDFKAFAACRNQIVHHRLRNSVDVALAHIATAEVVLKHLIEVSNAL